MNVVYTLKHLKYFLSLVEHQHFGKAADANFVTQPTLSAAIKEFEDILGLQLLERTKRKVIVTPLGYEVAEKANVIIRHAQELDDFCRAKTNPLSGKVKLGVIPTIAPFLLPKVMPSLREKFPELSLYLDENQTAVLVNEMEQGRLDAAILALPYDMPNMDHFIFAHDPFYLAAPDQNQITQKKSIDAEDLENLDLLLLQEGHCLRDHALNACMIKTAPKAVDFGATSLHTLIEMVASGLGVTLLPKISLNTDLVQNSRVKTIPLAKELPDRKIALVWRKTSGLSDDFKTLGEFLKTISLT